jgi:fibronectin type 3 domain-containing protein
MACWVLLVLASCGGGGSQGDAVVVPTATSGVSVSAGNNQNTVSWVAVAGASSYNIYRSTSQGQQGTKVGASTSTSYVDATAVNGLTYYYEVTADNAAGEGQVSAQSPAATPATPVLAPAAASGLTVVAGNAQVTLNWTAVAGATSYNVYRSTASGSQGAKVGASATTAYSDTTVVNGTAYFYAVTADNAAGEGPASAQSAGVTPAVPVTVPAPATGVNVVAGNASVAVSWAASAGATSYNIYRSTSQGSQGGKIGSSATTGYTDSAVLNGATYYYEVTAVNSAGESPASTQSAAASPAAPTGTGSAAALAKRLGLPNRFLIGLGSGGSDTTLIQTQGLKPDFFERYLVGLSSGGGWANWNTPPASGNYAKYQMQAADSVGAVPMFTLFQFSADNLSDMTNLADPTFMQTYWSDLITLFNQMGLRDKPALLNVEPDFFGFAQMVVNNNYGGDPTKAPAVMSTDAACAGLPANLTSYAPCLLKLARKYAPKTVIGFPPASWGASTMTSVVSFMNQLGTAQGDFIVMQTTDRDAGCREQYVLTPATTQGDCYASNLTGLYLDETNQTHPNFQDNFAMALAFHNGIGGLPIVWWQTPFGVPSSTPGGTPGHYRDNKVDYFLKHPSELVAVGGLGVVFGSGGAYQTALDTDGGQYQTLSKQYLAQPAPLP